MPETSGPHFTDLDEYERTEDRLQGEEVDVQATSALSGNAETGYTITNTHEPEKTEITGRRHGTTLTTRTRKTGEHHDPPA
jgi:hypothetical protein